MRRLLIAALMTIPAMAETPADIIARATPADWRPLDPDWSLVMTLESGSKVVIELNPQFAPANAGAIRTLALKHFYDGTSIYRVQDNYVVQFGNELAKKPFPAGVSPNVKDEFDRSWSADIPFTPLGYPDGYAAETGYSNGFAAARDVRDGKAWLTHCYGAVGMSRDIAADTGSNDLYVVTGQAPRHLDRNVTIYGRVVTGMEHLVTLTRGTEALGFLNDKQRATMISSIRMLGDMPEAERPKTLTLRTDTKLWADYVKVRANRKDDFFRHPARHVDVCNTLPPVKVP